MEGQIRYENYPSSTVLLANVLLIGTMVIGAFVLRGFGPLIVGLYIIYCAAMELNLYRSSCVNCYYYGKTCFSGRGRIAALFFKKGDTRIMAEKTATAASLVPDMLVTIFPLVGGAILLLGEMSWLILGLMVVLVLFMTEGNALVRGRLACNHCKQRELGCPAEKMFQKGKQQTQ